MKKVKILPIYLSFLILIYIISVMTVNLSSFPDCPEIRGLVWTELPAKSSTSLFMLEILSPLPRFSQILENYRKEVTQNTP
jgi:hypothetical protein